MKTNSERSVLNNTKTQSRPKLLFLVPAISQTHKSLENFQDFFVKTKTKTKTLGLKTKTKTLFFVLEAPRDQDFDLEDYITGNHLQASELWTAAGYRSDGEAVCSFEGVWNSTGRQRLVE